MDRMLRVNELLKRELGIAFERLVCPYVNALVTVTQVDTAPNLRNAIVYVSVYGDDSVLEEVNRLLRRNRAEVQTIISKNCNLKYTPKLEFRYDERTAKADRVMQLLDQLSANENKPQLED